MGEFLFGRCCIIVLMKIEFIADKLQVSGPRATDNSFVVKLETGEYEKSKLADLLLLDPGQVLKVSVETE